MSSDLWAKIDEITYLKSVVENRTSSIAQKKSTMEALQEIKGSIFSKGVSLGDANYVLEVGRALNVDLDLAKTDYAGTSSMAKVLSFDMELDKVISKIKELGR